MTYIDLTMPVDWEWMPDEVFATATRLVVGPPLSPLKGFTVGNETATCLLLPSQFAEFRKTSRIDSIDTASLVLRPTRVVDLSCEPGTAITADLLAPLLAEVETAAGDALLLRTGWGDSFAERRGSASYVLESPFLTEDGAAFLGDELRQRQSDLVLLDTALVSRPDRHLVAEWASLVPDSSPWPSDTARGYLRGYTKERVKEDWAADYALASNGVMVVKKLLNCGQLPVGSISLIIAPLLLVRAIGATCRVVAVVGQQETTNGEGSRHASN